MEEIEHHKFFQVFLPKNTDTENMSAVEMLMEEFHLSYNGKVTPDYEYDDSERSPLQVILYPSFIWASRELNRNSPFEQNKFVNECIDSEFVNMLFRIYPVYKVRDFIEYHFQFYEGETSEFLRHIKYSIIPIIRAKIENARNKDSELFGREVPEFDVIKDVIEDWMTEKKNDQSNSEYTTNIQNADNVIVNNNSTIEQQKYQKTKAAKNKLALIGIIISIFMLMIALISNWDRIIGLF
ncbi:MAG: hypothetical protein R8G66_23940 [Cytophagales bacterium]|nr:hypothetical protein [Cytophagales bacterium]